VALVREVISRMYSGCRTPAIAEVRRTIRVAAEFAAAVIHQGNACDGIFVCGTMCGLERFIPVTLL
jgi:hypothetical protein